MKKTKNKTKLDKKCINTYYPHLCRIISVLKQLKAERKLKKKQPATTHKGDI